MKFATLTPEQKSGRVFAVGLISAVVSAVTTWYYLASITFYPLLLVLFGVTVLLFRKSRGQLTPRRLYGLGLAIGAILMPLAGYIGLTLISQWDPKDTGWSHHPTFYAYISALVAVVASVAVTLSIGKRKQRHESIPV